MRFKEWGKGSVRARMTVLYGGLFAVITVAVLILAQLVQLFIFKDRLGDMPVAAIACAERPPEMPCSETPYDPVLAAKVLADDRTGLRDSLLRSQGLILVLAIVAIAVLAFVLSWWLTGRLLRPLHQITGTARRLSLSTLHERIALAGAPDELKELADTFDAMLDRLEDAVAGQRRFIANASHELRTPLAVQRTAIEVGLAGPTPEQLARIRAELLRNVERSEQLIEGLLVLAQGERGLDTRAPVELAATIQHVIADHQPAAQRSGVTIGAAIRPTRVAGDEVMLARLAANLIQNAIRHNHAGGQVLVQLADGALVVRNTGPEVPPERVGELFEPFRRLHRDRVGSAEGAGLGLSIVAAIAHAHGGTVTASAHPTGGLTVTVALPAADRVLTEPVS